MGGEIRLNQIKNKIKKKQKKNFNYIKLQNSHYFIFFLFNELNFY